MTRLAVDKVSRVWTIIELLLYSRYYILFIIITVRNESDMAWLKIIPIVLLLLGSIGCEEPAAPSTAPSLGYTLKVTDASGNTYTDLLQLTGSGIKVLDKTVRISARAAQRELPVYVVRKDALLRAGTDGSYELLPGGNELGIFVGAYPKGPQTIDIKWIRVFYKSPTPVAVTVRPMMLTGEPDTAYTFSVEMENPPAIGSYEWKKNDELLGRGGGKDVTTKFTVEGTYKISVTVYDTFFNETIGTGEATVTIKRKP